jgi:hypothetical protein
MKAQFTIGICICVKADGSIDGQSTQFHRSFPTTAKLYLPIFTAAEGSFEGFNHGALLIIDLN